MSIEIIRIPQLGEGLQEALLVEYLRQPGDHVKRDEPLYVMETDKATTEVESSFEGQIVEWLVEPGQVLEIGTEIGRMQVSVGCQTENSAAAKFSGEAVEESTAEVAATHSVAESSGSLADLESPKNRVYRLDGSQSVSTGERGAHRHRLAGSVRVPPRTRRHLQQLGLMDRIDEIPVRGPKLMPEDVDRYVAESLADGDDDVLTGMRPNGRSAARVTAPITGFNECAIPRRQLTLNYRLQRGLHQVVPATAVIEVDWSGLAEARELNRDRNGPTGFMMMLWCVTRSLVKFPNFRSTLVQDGRVLRTFDHVNLGVAVALPDDSLVTAVIPDADQLSPEPFWAAAADSIALAREGRDQADGQVTFTVSNVGTFGLDMGIPVVVPPAVATMGLGKVAPKAVPDGSSFKFIPSATLALTFDHRIVNGLGAGQFLSHLKSEIDGFSWHDLMQS